MLAALCATGTMWAAAAKTCDSLTRLKLPDTAITLAKSVAAGAFLPPGMAANDPGAGIYRKLPAFCRVVAELHPTNDSVIEMETWLPAAKWNGRFRGQGNGGFAGSIDYGGMASSLTRSFATAGSDAGHKGEGTDASWALGHPEKVADFGYRAVHEMTLKGKAVVAAFYGTAPRRTYFDSCSDGGREALMEAQRFPEDYDGILAGAPANNWTRMLAGGLSFLQTSERDAASFVPPERLSLLTDSALNACDASDGVEDGVLNDPSQCHFDPQSLLCGVAQTSACLTAAQVAVVKAAYRGGQTGEGEPIFPGLMSSSEDGEGGWADWVTGKSFGDEAFLKYTNGFFQNMVYENRNWDFRTANVDEALREAGRKLSKTLDSTDPDLSRLEARGGKLILYHGWLDPAISPLNSIDYFRSVDAKMGRTGAGNVVRLYMVPGMRHCAGGPGAYIFGQLGIGANGDSAKDVFAALEEWVEKDHAPARITATKLVDDKDPSKGVKMTRPLCPYPQVATYSGTGSTAEAKNFRCENPPGIN